jgi:hypothetical protein
LKRTSHVLLICTLCATLASPGYSWGDEGHELVARIAARNLTPNARARIVDLIRKNVRSTNDDLDLLPLVAQPTAANIEEVLVKLATWPDHIPSGKQETEPWHFVDVAIFEGATAATVGKRCPGGACISQKVTDMIANIRANKSIARDAGKQPPSFTPDLELRFLVHFLGDIHQPLHAATDADAGGNCIKSKNMGKQMHAIWDTALVILADGGSDDPAGDIIGQFTQQQKSTFQSQVDPIQIAIESFQIARTNVYPRAVPAVPVIPQFFDARPGKCETTAPAAINGITIDARKSFQNPESLVIIRQQLFKAGVRLAAILNAL